MTADQIQVMGEKAKVETWAGEYDEIEVDSESDSDEDEEDIEITEDAFTKNDVREISGASLNVYYTDPEGKRSAATEYMPGGMLTIDVAAADVQIYEAFIAVQAIDTAYDMYVGDSGKRLGTFEVTYPLPWEMEKAKVDVLGIKRPERIGEDLPEGLSETDESQGLWYQNEKAEFNETAIKLTTP